MAVLSRIAVLAMLTLAACYRPDLQSCTLTCGAPGDCADGQVCAEGWCVAPELAGTCGEPVADAAPGSVDASPDVRPDADRPPLDAGVVTLHVVIQDRGKVVIDPLGVQCVAPSSMGADCQYSVPLASTQTLLPVVTHHAFAGWTTPNCAGESGVCTLTMDSAVVLVGAAFDH